MAQITITNITKINNTQYSIEFSNDFTMVDLFYELSLDGSTWQSPIAFTAFTSPQIISLPSVINFNVRLSSNYTPPYSRIHSIAFTETFN